MPLGTGKLGSGIICSIIASRAYLSFRWRLDKNPALQKSAFVDPIVYRHGLNDEWKNPPRANKPVRLIGGFFYEEVQPWMNTINKGNKSGFRLNARIRTSCQRKIVSPAHEELNIKARAKFPRPPMAQKKRQPRNLDQRVLNTLSIRYGRCKTAIT